MFAIDLSQYRPAQLLIGAGLVAFLALGFWKLVVYPVLFDPLRILPGPKAGFTLTGYAFEHMKRPVSGKLFQWITTIPNDGLIRYPGVLGESQHVPTTPRMISELLVGKAYDFQKPEAGRNILRIILGDGLVVSEGDTHRFQRKNVNPMFSFRHIKELYPLMWSKSLDLVRRIRNDLSPLGDEKLSGVVEVNHWASRATLDIIGVAALGRNLNTLHNTDDPLAQIYESLTKVDRSKRLWFLILAILPKRLVDLFSGSINRGLLAKAADLRQICRKFVNEKRISMANETDNSADILAHLISSNNFSDSELVDQLLTMLAAGHETTSSMFTWTLAALAQHPEYQQKLHEELSANLDPAEPASASAATLESLPWLNGICNETLRLFPAVPVTRRVAIRDTRLGDFFIPRGTMFVVPIWWWNRLPELWGADAAVFSPERWTTEESGKPNNSGGAESNYALMTFLHGAHSCIGQGFAKAELRCLVAAWMMDFRFKMANEGQKLIEVGRITVKPKGGLWLKVDAMGVHS